MKAISTSDSDTAATAPASTHDLEAANCDAAARDAADIAYLRADSQPEPPESGGFLSITDLFSGLGGMTIGAVEGARRAGRRARLALAVDREEEAIQTLGRTLDAEEACVTADLESTLRPFAELPSADESKLFEAVPHGGLLVAGPPCQGHSTLNNHTRHDDPRNDLYLAVARAAKLVKPKAVIIENVRSIENDRRGSVGKCTALLEELGYEVDAAPRDLHNVGVPQRRFRHVLVATLGSVFDWNLVEAGGRTVEWAIKDLLDVENAGWDAWPRASADNRRRIEWLFENDAFNLPNEERPKCHHDDHTYVSMYGRLKWGEPAQTITTGFSSMGQGRYVHPSERRALTHHEAARLQFLPDFIDLGETKGRRGAVATMIGNAAPPKLTMAIVEALIGQDLL